MSGSDSADPGPPPVEIVLFPDQPDRLEELRAGRHPRLVVVTRATDRPPGPPDPLEDWIWTPTSEQDVFTRLQRLAARAPVRREVDLDHLVIDEDGVLRVAGEVLIVPQVEAKLLRVLLEPPVRVRSRSTLIAAAWGGESRSDRSLDSRIGTLRRRLATVGIALWSVRGHGYLLAVPLEEGGS